MKPAPIGADEAYRLAALHRYRILDTAPEPEFNDFTEVAAQLCGTPIALVSLVDADRQWFKSRIGIDSNEAARDTSFCGHAIHHGPVVFEVPDALQDERFADNPFVTQSPNVRFYAGTPLIAPDGHAVGTLCVIDSVPHTLTPAQRSALSALGRQVVRQMEQRLLIQREKQLFTELSKQAKFQQVLLDSAVAAVISTDPHGLITSFNPAAEHLLGYRAEEVVDRERVTLFHVREELEARAGALSLELGRLVEPREAIVVKALAGESETHEWSFRRKDGALVPVMLSVSALHDDAGRVVGYLGLAWDIAERKQADLALRQSQERLQLAMNAAQISMWDANPLTGRIVLDAHWAALIGEPPQEMDISFLQLAQRVPPQEVPGVQAKMLAVIKGEQPDYIAEHRVQHRDGHWIWIESRGKVVERDAQGRAIRMIGTNTDISERKRAEQLKSEFVATVSHELRTPLTSISGALGLIGSGALGPLSDKARTLLEIASRNSQQLTRLINDLLDMEKLAADKMWFDLQTQALMPLVEHAIESARPYAQQYGVVLALVERADTARVRVDGGRLQQVLGNYLSNAAKFSPHGAQVDVLVRVVVDVARVEVVDRGPGISEDFKKRIFEKFSQADASNTRQKGGTGLGLAISKELIERMHGRVGFESQEGKGARFFFELPLVPESTATPRSG